MPINPGEVEWFYFYFFYVSCNISNILKSSWRFVVHCCYILIICLIHLMAKTGGWCLTILWAKGIRYNTETTNSYLFNVESSYQNTAVQKPFPCLCRLLTQWLICCACSLRCELHSAQSYGKRTVPTWNCSSHAVLAIFSNQVIISTLRVCRWH